MCQMLTLAEGESQGSDIHLDIKIKIGKEENM
jgi:hypothetical protein